MIRTLPKRLLAAVRRCWAITESRIRSPRNQVSDQLLIRLLEAYNPEKYGRRRGEQTNLTDIDPDKLTPELLNKIADHLLKKALGDNRQP
jgi:hypothetical protein